MKSSLWKVFSRISAICAIFLCIIFIRALVLVNFINWDDPLFDIEYALMWVGLIGTPIFAVAWWLFINIDDRKVQESNKVEALKRAEEAKMRKEAIKKGQEQLMKDAYEKVTHIWPYGNKCIKYARELYDGTYDIVSVSLIPVVRKRNWKIIVDDKDYEDSVLGQTSITCIMDAKKTFATLNKNCLVINNKEWKNIEAFQELSNIMDNLKIDSHFVMREYANAGKDVLDLVEKYKIQIDTTKIKSELLVSSTCNCYRKAYCKIRPNFKKDWPISISGINLCEDRQIIHFRMSRKLAKECPDHHLKFFDLKVEVSHANPVTIQLTEPWRDDETGEIYKANLCDLVENVEAI